jgi:pullulanase/glycogen debranching enzyme
MASNSETRAWDNVETAARAEDISIYEIHIRDFSVKILGAGGLRYL